MENILITGASTGIGYHLCQVFIKHGFRVFGSVRKDEDAQKLKVDFGDNFHALLFDVTDHDSVQTAIDELTLIIGQEGLYGLINNAGMAVSGTIVHTSIADYQKQFDVNFFGVIAVTKACLTLLGARKDAQHEPGKIINISSVSGKIAFPFLSPYCASKFALEAFSDSLRREMLLYGIHVITIGPGPIRTPIWRKSEISTETMQSDYGPSLIKFQKSIAKSVKNAMDPEELANRIYKVFIKKKSRTRYTFLNKKFLNYTIPRYFISPRQFDRFVGKLFSDK